MASDSSRPFRPLRPFPSSVLQADTMIVSCGLANFEVTTWSKHRCHKFWGLRKELTTKADYVKFPGSFEINYPGVSDGRSAWMIDCRELNDPECDKLLKIHVDNNPRIMKSTMASSGYHELHSRLYEDMPRFLSRKNIVIRICRDGRYRSVANAEMWSNTLTRNGQSRHSVSLLHLAELDFWQNTCEGKCPGCIKETTRTSQRYYDCSRAECSRLASSSYSETEHRKRTRQETPGQSQAEKSSSKTTRAAIRHGKPSTEPGNPGRTTQEIQQKRSSTCRLCTHARHQSSRRSEHDRSSHVPVQKNTGKSE